MLQIDIDIPRPKMTLAMLAIAAWWVFGGLPATSGGLGGRGQVEAEVVREAEEDIRDIRVEREVLSRRADILRHQLSLLERDAAETSDPELVAELLAARRDLAALMKDDREAERQLLASLHELWEAQGYAMRVSHAARGEAPVSLDWPVDPELGISAHFHDDGYKKRFGFDHGAIDIPVEQGSVVYAAADGIVAKVSDNGMGFSSLSVDHGGGIATLYGHVSEFLVKEGERVRAGQPIVLSGGQPGTRGAGRVTTGPHLHFEVFVDGKKVDPLRYLPEEY
jgi:murein DD-endopeptidase MepM/ murein hydrolase activator NlpD